MIMGIAYMLLFLHNCYGIPVQNSLQKKILTRNDRLAPIFVPAAAATTDPLDLLNSLNNVWNKIEAVCEKIHVLTDKMQKAVWTHESGLFTIEIGLWNEAEIQIHAGWKLWGQEITLAKQATDMILSFESNVDMKDVSQEGKDLAFAWKVIIDDGVFLSHTLAKLKVACTEMDELVRELALKGEKVDAEFIGKIEVEWDKLTVLWGGALGEIRAITVIKQQFYDSAVEYLTPSTS